ncbi:similar to cDNA sequence BC016188, isoform CRA_b [Rattus norvegicus]|uniref:Similar to cDNA sequence BC016188, isoform CRA_b n=1 Tax=Rattus norvegicus TaxID=10116 RepID=A6IYA8_RAT|nr:similar to cDNA sequence BC016188, isoform CRA_b [Rattus norvegicus]
MQAIWSASCTSIQRLPGAWAMTEAGRPRRRHCTGGTWWRVSCSDSAGEAHPGPQPDARQSSRATEETSRQSVDNQWFWAPPVRAPGPRGIRTAPHPSLAGRALESPVCTSRSVWSKESS